MSADEPNRKDLSTVSAAWRTGDEAQRWEVLNSLFERIHVRQDRKVEGYTPRMDHANRVRLLINTAFDYVYGWSEREAEGPGALTKRLRRGAEGFEPSRPLRAYGISSAAPSTELGDRSAANSSNQRHSPSSVE